MSGSALDDASVRSVQTVVLVLPLDAHWWKPGDMVPKNTLDTPVVVRDAQDGWTAIMAAAQNGHTSTVALLLEKGASVNHANKVKWCGLSSC